MVYSIDVHFFVKKKKKKKLNYKEDSVQVRQ